MIRYLNRVGTDCLELLTQLCIHLPTPMLRTKKCTYLLILSVKKVHNKTKKQTLLRASVQLTRLVTRLHKKPSDRVVIINLQHLRVLQSFHHVSWKVAQGD